MRGFFHHLKSQFWEMKASWLPTYILDPSIQFWLLTPFKGAWLHMVSPGFTSNQVVNSVTVTFSGPHQIVLKSILFVA